ncbi:sensor histidine kinase [Paraburkholderia lacunae]|uniref:sensor histidine kinase n=1 Tax=Paraburkholderia lacunae TaxID=2211104 RepID=UPI001FCCB8E9|nr:7TM diverse intracellular signaling domain-containing protein [Paraburkholderia lacunae]
MLAPSSWALAPVTPPAETPSFSRVEAVRAQTLAAPSAIPIERAQPPATGWVDVKLPDYWSTRWPDFDGVVWYRLTWQQVRVDAPSAVLLDYLNMSGAIYLNGTLLNRDTHLTEPLSRAWNTPRYLLLPAALLHEGTNTLLVRVSGIAMYQAGLGPAAIGPPALMQARFDDARRVRLDLQLVSLAVTATLGCFFLSMWLMRSKETVYGWFAVTTLAWWVVGYNQVATSTWPFASTDGWEIVNTIAFSVYCASYTVFILRFCARRWPRYERVLWGVVVLSSVVLACQSHQRVQNLRALLETAQALHYFATSLVFLFFAWRRGNTEHRILGCCVAVFVAAGLHDLLAFLAILHDNIYYTALTSQLLMVGMALMLGRQFIANLRRIEGFNKDLAQSVEAARSELTRTLQRQHELEIANARLGERLNLAHDLHDGLGGTLVSSIVTLERAPHDVPPQRFLSILKELRDDLRIIIDSAASQHYGETTLADQIAPLRHRLTRLLDTEGIECRWHASGIEGCVLPAAKSLEIMRILQEALTNVFKHSRASRVEVGMCHDEQGLRVTVHDNGVGIAPGADTDHHGTGMHSMRARVGRLGGIFDIESSPGSTLVAVQFPSLAMKKNEKDPPMADLLPDQA